MPRTIETLLCDARVFDAEYAHYQSPGVHERIARALARRERKAVTPGDPNTAPQPAAAPATGPEHEQAGFELDLAAALVLNTAQCAAHLARLSDDSHIDPEGALVFACLLHLTRRDSASLFWWQFAAGAGSHTAAYFLSLYHRRHAEFRDAEYWRRQSVNLRLDAPTRPDSHLSTLHLLPRHVRNDILAQCHQGKHPHLPLAFEAVINQLAVLGDDEDFGEIPQPSAHLTTALSNGS